MELEAFHCLRDGVKLFLASQEEGVPIVLNTGIRAHAWENGEDDIIMIGESGRAVTAQEFYDKLDTISYEDFVEGRSYFFEGLRWSLSEDGSKIEAYVRWGSWGELRNCVVLLLLFYKILAFSLISSLSYIRQNATGCTESQSNMTTLLFEKKF